MNADEVLDDLVVIETYDTELGQDVSVIEQFSKEQLLFPSKPLTPAACMEAGAESSAQNSFAD